MISIHGPSTDKPTNKIRHEKCRPADNPNLEVGELQVFADWIDKDAEYLAINE
jgi:hypothetical protein